MNGAVSALKPRHKRASNGKPLNVVPTNHSSEVLQVQDLIMSSSSSFFSKKLRLYGGKASFMTWRLHDVLHVAKHHWIPCVFAMGLLFFMGVEYTLRMVPSSSPPFDVGFVTTRSLHLLLASKPKLNTLLAGLNTVFVGMQTTYIVWTWLVEGRPRATISALFMFTCRGILGYSTQLPLPQGFLGSGADFPVGNVSFFLFFSGHVAGSVIASLDMRRMHRWEMARTFDALNVLQALRLLGTRGHYTIDLAVGVGAGFLFDSLAGKYEESKRSKAPTTTGTKEAFFL
ncbi:PREDICTED: phosphatidylcholine:diacylglycerol cholinephosphotransferase 1-like [Prunus mume]|uniref:Phosphatidylcholine:diacylglycerol cholinephosphotransferase 1-like n=1 Tax=Prunus mume TaxID=102107 RepID=A0ABM0NRE8_PRUMU|nr:PREDICTED: phosphatidylcholine:diacylglycerol cholinephosphotransferase 1-like [Prunus mume]